MSPKTLTGIVYLLQILSIASVGSTLLIGAVISYWQLSTTKETWLESHVRWQMTTFWVGLGFGILGVVLIAYLVGMIILVADALWIVYRVVPGWTRLNTDRSMDNG